MGNNCCRKKCKIEDVVKLYPTNFNSEHEFSPSSNLVRTTKYTFYNFLFLNLYEQFKRYSNLFFIFCVILNFIPQIGFFSNGTAIIPVLFILLTTLIKDGIEDLRRYVSDKRVNNFNVLKYNKAQNKFTPSQWKDIHVGDFVQISSNERIPADLLIYHSSNVSGICFIETADIDGETTLKQRSIIKPFSSETNLENQFQQFYLEVEAPNKEIYKFSGNLIDSRNDESVLSLKANNLIIRETILRNTTEVRGMVIYAGNETKVFMNNDKARFKRSLLEHQLNWDMLMCLIILFITCCSTAIGYTIWLNNYNNWNSIVFLIPNSQASESTVLRGFYQFWTSVILFQAIIPISVYITLELVKAHQVFHISNDLALYDKDMNKKIEVKAYNITEDMGQIKHMFCDKTGTLTDNEMIFRKASIFGNVYIANDRDLTLRCSNLEEKDTILGDPHMMDFLMVTAICNTTIINNSKKINKRIVHIESDDKGSTVSTSAQSDLDRLQNKIEISYLIPPRLLGDNDSIPRNLKGPTHEVAESVQSASSFGKSSIQTNMELFHRPLSNEELFPLILSESPDEDALVKMVIGNGYKLHHRSYNSVVIWNDISKKWLNYEILKTLPFDSTRKCMSVIVRDLETRRITLHCKGADSTMFKKMRISVPQHGMMIETMKTHIHRFASDGLRTLVMGRRNIKESEYQKWENLLLDTEKNFIDNEKAIQGIYELIEKNLEIIGAVGLEDKLQEFVPEILESLKEAGINIWILTGDKKETAISIAYSTKLFGKKDIILEVTSESQENLMIELVSIRKKIEKSIYHSKVHPKRNTCKHKIFGLVVDGCSLSLIFDFDELKSMFLHVSYFCSTVVCCRCTPIHKGMIVKLIKTTFEVRTLAVGDGANDVNMIQTADIGVGISGKEGSQATMASDFAITKFKFLKRLILVHGHWSYDKLARMSLYMFYKNTMISMVLYMYQWGCGFSGAAAIDQVIQITIHIIQTGLPPLIYGIWDKDFSDQILMANPQIYKTGINSKMYRPRDFWRNVLDAIWQAFWIFIIPWISCINSDLDVQQFGLLNVTCACIIMFAQIIIECKHWNPFMWVVVFGCMAIGFYIQMFIVNVLCIAAFDCNTDNPYKVLQHTMLRGKTYIIITVTVATALFPRLFVKGFLLENRDSIYYEAHHRITRRGISKISSTVISTKQVNQTISQYDFKKSDFYLGNLESLKTSSCTKCKYRDEHYNRMHNRNNHNGILAPFFRYRKSQIIPSDA